MKLKSLIVCCLVALSTLISTANFAATVDIRFANTYVSNCASGTPTFCFTVQIISGDFDFEVGNATVFFNYNADAITSPVHTSLNFDLANGYGYDPQMSFLETMGAGTSSNDLGEVNYAILLSDGGGTGTPTVTDQTWVDVAEFCFTVVDPTETPDLQFVIANPINGANDDYTGFNNEDNIRSNSHVIGNAYPLDPSLACPFEISLSVILEGPHTGSGVMTTALQSGSLSSGFAQPIIPFKQPYTTAPWNHTFTAANPAKGSEAIVGASLPTNMVDWVLVEASTDGTTAGIVESRAGILMNNGDIMDPNTPSQFLLFYNLTSGSAYTFIIRHRNHLDVATHIPITVQSTPSPYTALTNSTGEFYSGFVQTKNLGGSVYGMRLGDLNGDNFCDFNDFIDWRPNSGDLFEYQKEDMNMDSFVDFNDFIDWRPNSGALAPVSIWP